MKISDTYRVVLDVDGSTTTLYIHAPTGRAARTQAKREYKRGTVHSCSPEDPPDGAEIMIYKGYVDTDR